MADKTVQNGGGGGGDGTKIDEAAASRVIDVPWYRSCRVMLAIVAAWGYTFFYILRIDLSMAIVCMVREPSRHVELPVWNASYNSSNEMGDYSVNAITATYHQPPVFNWTSATPDHDSQHQCDDGLLSSKKITRRRNTGELEWSKELRGYILSSFFYGYIVTQVPGGWLASRLGGKHVFGTGVLITLIATILVPVAARTHAYLLIVLRVIMGLGCGVGFPATHHLFGRWLPPLERSRLMAFSYAGTYLGTIFAMVFSGFLCDSGVDNGWPLIFYVYGGLTFVWYVLWNFFVYDSPETHPRIDPIEREYIMKSIGSGAYEQHTYIPWRAIFRSAPVWAIITAHSCNNWANYTLLMCAPIYMKEVLKFDIKQNGALSALPHIISYLSGILSGYIADMLRRKKILSTTVTRKVFQCLSSSVPAVLIVSIGFIDCQRRYLAVAILCLTLFFNSFCRAGLMVNHVDISPKYAGILFGVSNTAATVPGMLAPTVVGLITTHGTREEWMVVFVICGAFYVFSTVIYGIFASGNETKLDDGGAAADDLEKKTTGCLKTLQNKFKRVE